MYLGQLYIMIYTKISTNLELMMDGGRLAALFTPDHHNKKHTDADFIFQPEQKFHFP